MTRSYVTVITAAPFIAGSAYAGCLYICTRARAATRTTSLIVWYSVTFMVDMACILMVCVAMRSIVMAYILQAYMHDLERCGLYNYGLYSDGLYSYCYIVMAWKVIAYALMPI